MFARSRASKVIAAALQHQGDTPVDLEQDAQKLATHYYGYKGAYETLSAEVGELRQYKEACERRSAEKDSHEALAARFGQVEKERDGYKAAYERLNAEVGELSGYRNAYEELAAENGELRGYKVACERLNAEVGELSGYRKAYEELAAENGELRGYKAAYEALSAEAGELRGYKAAYDELNAEVGELRSYRTAYEELAAEIGCLQGVAPDRQAVRTDSGALGTDGDRTAHGSEPCGAATSDSPMDAKYTFEVRTRDGLAALQAGDREQAIELFVQALRTMNGFGPARMQLQRISKELFAEALAARDRGQLDEAIDLLVRSVELNPDSGEARAELDRLVARDSGIQDVTKQCFIHPDKRRAERVYREAIRRAIEFTAYGGIDGDILEFGVLGGWTARLFAETMRDIGYFGDLYLFDSFEGLPAATDNVDAGSYDVARGVWRENMRLPREYFDGGETDPGRFIAKCLSRVISNSRIKVRAGFYEDTLKEPPACKAAIVHLDCDLFASTQQVLDALDRGGILQDGTVMMFDDWNCNRANPNFGQRRAFREFLDARNARLSASPFFTYGFNSAAFILHVDPPLPAAADALAVEA